MLDYELIKPFRKATLHDSNGDITKRWFVGYYVWDEKTNRLVRKKYYKRINTYKTVEERRAEGKRLVKAINKLLEDGYDQKMTTNAQPLGIR